MARKFTEQHSIMRTIWGNPDLVLMIFAGSAAEFALNRAVDWLFFTNELPSDPIGRLFSTVEHAQRIVFSGDTEAQRTLASIRAAHASVERARGQRIPDWAHRDVLYMLIDYSQRSYGLFRRDLTQTEQESLYAGFLRLGQGLQIPLLPATFKDWEQDRQRHLDRDLAYSEHTSRLFEQYRLHLGIWRYQLLLELQALLVPQRVRELLRLQPKRLLITSCLQVYSRLAQIGLRPLMQRTVVPPKYWSNLDQLRPEVALRDQV